MRRAFLGFAAISVAAAAVLAGCAGVSGTILRSAEVTEQFNNGVILPGHTYYWSGVEDEPDGILAVAEGFTLKTALWNEFAPGSGKLREMVGRMRVKGGYVSDFPFGSVLLTDDGRQLGVWFSQADWTAIRMHGDNTVEITTPGKILQDRRDNRRDFFRR